MTSGAESMKSSFEKQRQEFLKKNREERLKFVDFWASYVRTHPDRDWSSQQRVIIDSQIQGARGHGWTPEEFVHMKDEKKTQKHRANEKFA